MDNNHERTKEVLANMDHEAEDIKLTVYKSQSELQEALKKLMDDCDISGKKIRTWNLTFNPFQQSNYSLVTR